MTHWPAGRFHSKRAEGSRCTVEQDRPTWSEQARRHPAVWFRREHKNYTRKPRTFTVSPPVHAQVSGCYHGNRLASLLCIAGSFSGDPSPSSSFSEELLPQQQYFKQPQQAERTLSTPRVIPTGDRFSSAAERAGFRKKGKHIKITPQTGIITRHSDFNAPQNLLTLNIQRHH